MTNEELRMRLLQYGKEIFKPGDFHDQLAPAVMGYSDLLSAHFVIDAKEGRAHIKTPHGNAIGSLWAAHCGREVLRTQRFSRGLAHAISVVLLKGKKPVHVLYAGTGPFATLALPVMMTFKAEDVQFTFLEINPESINVLKRVIDTLDLHAYVKDIHQCDASVWEVVSTDVDIVISETMYKALSAEPQVAIMLNLVSQLPPETVFLPEEIKVSLCKWNQRDQVPQQVAELISFDKECMYSIIQQSSGKNWVFNNQQIQLTLSEEEQLYLATDIRVNEGNTLLLNESSLNLLAKVKLTKKQGAISLHCRYSLQDPTGFSISEIE
ncbi:SAM-dependent methyltransferase [Chitinophaga pinensis]|uniref:Phytanoyl-CoA dioxygenase (PhyH) family n=1 Tax=Chitinophaga pinensis (strain ATCC 43595 / DSM 2588 / LMG 13176 / NBRC 15968 / NCIMB 11800 / UQM 2034) TaxID=485918 RepID=A0A979G4C0_CHIPD|nr:hypothetical protein [Chitinophaga pinensis]ACU60343.1 phytanoyl-CoA dioxygenase (PhyH) family [Chitinophaga pinensis DSM 2588]